MMYRKQLAINFSSHKDAQDFINFISDGNFGEISSNSKAVRFVAEFINGHKDYYQFGDGFTEDTAILDIAEGSFDYPTVFKIGDLRVELKGREFAKINGDLIMSFNDIQFLYKKMESNLK